MPICWSDTETYSETPIRNGTYVYSENAEVMLWAYAFDDGPVFVWDLTDGSEMPEVLAEAIDDPETTFVFHNSMFDRTVIRYSEGIALPVDRVEDTMVQALTHSLPGALGMLCEVLGVDAEDAKHKRGKELVRMFCMPQKSRKKNEPELRRLTRETNPEEWQEFIDYAGNDITAMRAIYYKMPRWNYRDGELELWRLDQRINDRGFKIDKLLADKAIEAIATTQKRLSNDVRTQTLGVVNRATERDKLLRFITKAYGVDLPDLQKDTLQRRLNDPDLPREVKELLALRLESAKASTAKYRALVKAVNTDGRLRGTLQFCGASRTGRDAGRTFQPQNLYRPTMKNEEIEDGIDLIKSGEIPENTMEITANAVRGSIIADEGKKLVFADLSNIEGRFAAWSAGEEWKCEAFLENDAGRAPDLYKVAYGRAFRVDPDDVDDGTQRQIGKVMELMLQYGGGVGAFLTGAATYGIDLDELRDIAWNHIPKRVKEAAERWWHVSVKEGNTYGLEKETFITCDSLKRMWRENHPAISSIWYELEDAVIGAINNPGTPYQVRKYTVQRDGSWLKIRLPSGRYLCYPGPRLNAKGKIQYYGTNPYSRKWGRLSTYGGKLFENVVQAGARDVFMHSLEPAETVGFEVIMRVHDELVTEAPDEPQFSAELLSNIMATNPVWAKGLPLAAGGVESYRYRKD